MRVAVIGARRQRQGIGEHLARFFAAAGVDLVAVLGTRPETVREALERLAAHGLHPAGHLDPYAMLREDRPDLLVIASPAETHDRYLTLALSAGLHVLCEKPLCWGGDDPAERARRHADAFALRGLHLAVNVQWPYTLDAYRRLHPGVLEGGPRRFHMRLSPDARGGRMIPEALPHALSLLHAVAPDPAARVEAPALRVLDAAGERLEVRFDYVGAHGRIAARVDLVRGRAQPRAASYAFDGHEAVRRVETADYRLRFEAGGRTVPLPDPTPRLVEAFLTRVSSGAAPRPDPAAFPGMDHLARIAAAWPAAERAGPSEQRHPS